MLVPASSCTLALARDLAGLHSPTTTLLAIAARHVPHARVHERQHRLDGALQSVTRGSKNEYLVRGYDKAYELLAAAGKRRDDRREPLTAWSAASAGQLRYELQLRAPLLRRKGLTTMTDLNESRLDDLAREYFVKARWDAPYGGKGRVQQKVEELRDEMTPSDWRSLCALLFCAERGIDQPLTRHVLDRVRPVVRRHNLLDVEDEHGLRRLDFNSGVEVSEH
jgi:hypothetical protein